MDVLTFSLDDQAYGLPVGRVREVVRAVAIRALPGAPEIAEGVIGVRGSLVPVLDLRARFGHPPRAVDPDHHLILAEAGGRLLAFRVDAARNVESVEPSTLAPVPGWSGRAEYVAGLARTERGLVVIHDLDTFLSDSEAASLDAATAGHTATAEHTVTAGDTATAEHTATGGKG